MYRKFIGDIFVRFLVVMKNVLISFIKEYRAPTLRPPMAPNIAVRLGVTSYVPMSIA